MRTRSSSNSLRPSTLRSLPRVITRRNTANQSSHVNSGDRSLPLDLGAVDEFSYLPSASTSNSNCVEPYDTLHAPEVPQLPAASAPPTTYLQPPNATPHKPTRSRTPSASLSSQPTQTYSIHRATVVKFQHSPAQRYHMKDLPKPLSAPPAIQSSGSPYFSQIKQDESTSDEESEGTNQEPSQNVHLSIPNFKDELQDDNLNKEEKMIQEFKLAANQMGFEKNEEVRCNLISLNEAQKRDQSRRDEFELLDKKMKKIKMKKKLEFNYTTTTTTTTTPSTTTTIPKSHLPDHFRNLTNRFSTLTDYKTKINQLPVFSSISFNSIRQKKGVNRQWKSESSKLRKKPTSTIDIQKIQMIPITQPSSSFISKRSDLISLDEAQKREQERRHSVLTSSTSHHQPQSETVNELNGLPNHNKRRHSVAPSSRTFSVSSHKRPHFYTEEC
ncbi:hypothetical protein CROQUDRAFT_108699 [Cronartium quercuum f. sp. fusiforme G11]|uniref:Uncharacterized protein n=1 Tax=Cronartium quercuum f. sp. fusiforme G11 TaxID=708437 RepID=A0A9P6T9E1_9BASI|nr:hypothetical protein CROQUDRAFT_108699 [Cronartium quercuum f. sp. fusiforme G11]